MNHASPARSKILFWLIATLLYSRAAWTQTPFSASMQLEGAVELQPLAKTCTFHMRAEAHALIRAVLQCYGIETSIDDAVPRDQVSFQMDDASFPEALQALELATGTFAVPAGARRAVIRRDTVDDRKRCEHLELATLRLSGMSPAERSEVTGLMRSLLEPGQYSLEANSGNLTLRAPASELLPIEAALHELLNGRSVVLLDVELYEMGKSTTRNIGVILPGSTKLFNVASEVDRILAANTEAVRQIIANGLADPGDYQKIVAILIASGAVTDSAFNSPFAVFGGGLTEMGVNVGNVAAEMVLNSSEVRSLRQIQLRLLDQEQGTIRIGLRYPILISATANIGSSLSGVLVPQFQYQDLGVTLKATPCISRSEEIALTLDLSVSGLTGTSVGGLPVLSNRQYSGEVVLHSGQSALLLGDLAKQSAAGRTGKLQQNASHDLMELILMVTPHVVRIAHHEASGPVFLLPTH